MSTETIDNRREAAIQRLREQRLSLAEQREEEGRELGRAWALNEHTTFEELEAVARVADLDEYGEEELAEALGCFDPTSPSSRAETLLDAFGEMPDVFKVCGFIAAVAEVYADV